MSSLEAESSSELIFFDTFSHDNDEEHVLKPVFPTVIDLGKCYDYQSQIKETFRATNPSSFDIQFFVNDLSKPEVSTFTEIGSLSYHQNETEHLIAEVRRITDGLLIRGRYRTLTIGVFGKLIGSDIDVLTGLKIEEKVEDVAKVEEKEDNNENILGDKRQEVIDVIMQRLASAGERKAETLVSPEAKKRKMSPPIDLGSPIPEKLSKRSIEDVVRATPSFDELSASNFSDVKTPRSIDEVDGLVTKSPLTKDLENISPENSMSVDDLITGEAISSDEADFDDLPSVPTQVEQSPPRPAGLIVPSIVVLDELDPISSDEDDIEPIDVDYNDKSDYVWTFDASKVDLKPIAVTEMVCNFTSESEKLKSAIASVSEYQADCSVREKWVEVMESIVICFNPKCVEEEQVQILLNWTISALDFDLAVEQNLPAMKVRQLKAGIKLLTFLTEVSSQVTDEVCRSNAFQCLLNLYDKDHMTIPVKLLILNAINISTNSLNGIKYVLDANSIFYNGSEKINMYQWLLQQIISKPSTRLLLALAALLKKLRFFEKLESFGDGEDSISSQVQTVHQYLNQSSTFMKQPTRILPATKIFEIKKNDTTDTVIMWLRETSFLKKCLDILQRSTHHNDMLQVIQLLITILRMREGYELFLHDHISCDLTKKILECMSQFDSKLSEQVAHYFNSVNLFNQVIGLLQVSSGKIDTSDTDIAVNLNKLFMSLFDFQGRNSITQLLSSEKNLSVVIKIVGSLNGSSNDDDMIVREYLSRILVEFVRNYDNNVLDLLHNFGKEILDLCSKNQTMSPIPPFISRVMPFIPFNYNASSFELLNQVLRHACENDIKASLIPPPIIPPHVLTCLRILDQISVPPEEELFLGEDCPQQLKYDYGLVMIHSSGSYSSIVALLDHLTRLYINVSHVHVYSGSNYFSVLSVFKHCVVIISAIIHKLVRTRGKSFQDHSSLMPLLNVHSLLSNIPPDHESIDEVEYILDTMISTISVLTLIHDEEGNISNPKAAKLILKFTLSTPLALKSGLCVLSKLFAVQQEESEFSRKILNSYFKETTDEIDALASSLCCCSDPEIRELVVIVLAEICDLSHELASTVVKSFMSQLISIRLKRPQLESFLWLLSRLMDHWSFRVTFTLLMTDTSFKKEPGNPFIHDLLLLSNPLDAEILMNIIGRLFDRNEALAQMTKEGINILIIFILIKLETGSLVDSPALAKMAFRILSLLCQSDLGLFQLRINLKNSGQKVLSCFLDKLMLRLMSGNENLSASCTILKAFINFFMTLHSSSSESQFGLKTCEVRDLLKSSASSGPDSFETLVRCFQVMKPSSDPLVTETMTLLKTFTDLVQKSSNLVLTTGPPIEPKTPKSETLASLFTKKPTNDDIETAKDLKPGDVIEIDLISLGKCVMGMDYNLSECIKEHFVKAQETNKPKLQTSDSTEKKLLGQELLISAKTIANPARGRGRGIASRYDPFRTRPPNTSRPPSMHVDDFVAMEKDGANTKNRRLKDFQGNRTSSAPSPLYTSSPSDARNVVQKGSSFPHRRSPYLSPRSGTSNWPKTSSTSSTNYNSEKRTNR